MCYVCSLEKNAIVRVPAKECVVELGRVGVCLLCGTVGWLPAGLLLLVHCRSGLELHCRHAHAATWQKTEFGAEKV